MTKFANGLNLAKKHKIDLILYVIIGVLAFIADFTVLQLTDKITQSLLLATISGLLAGFIISYWLNHLRFKKRHTNTRSIKQALPIFVALFVFNTIFTFLCLDYNDKHQLVPRIIVKMGTVCFIMIWNYVMFHNVVYRQRAEIVTITKELI